MMQKYITIDEYGKLNDYAKTFYSLQYQEYVAYQPGAESWQDISETKASYTNNPTQKVYKLKE